MQLHHQSEQQLQIQIQIPQQSPPGQILGPCVIPKTALRGNEEDPSAIVDNAKFTV